MARGWTLGRTCTVEGCEGKHRSQGLCNRHYLRMKRRQSTEDLSRKVPAIERFLAFVAPQPNGCWLWTGTVTVRGYGYFSTGIPRGEGPDMMSAHRWAYQFWVGPIPAGKQLDHTCHRECVGGDSCPHRRCVNPDHLEPVTNRENVVRGNAARITCGLP